MKNKKIIITGGSGFLGSCLTKTLVALGFSVVIIDIVKPKINNSHVSWLHHSLLDTIPKDKLLKKPHAVINLAGNSIFGRWTNQKKELIYSTRVTGTKHLVELMSIDDFKPNVFISASAVGWYGHCYNKVVDEKSSSAKNTYLAKVAIQWENEAMAAQKFIDSVHIVRHAHILGQGGLLGVQLPIFKAGIGGHLGKGNQYFPWIHISDVVSVYLWLLTQSKLQSGLINATAPEIVTQKQFSERLAVCVKRHSWLHVPVWVMRLFFGDLAQELVASQKVYPRTLHENGFTWKHSKLSAALAAAIGQ